jgi:hypothetical protein
MGEKSTGLGPGSSSVFAVDKFGVQDEVLRLYKEGVSSNKISKILSEKGIHIAHNGINRWLAEQRTKANTEIQTQNAEKFAVMVVDYQDEVKGILDEVKEMKALAKSDSDLKAYDRMVGRLFQGIELLAKLKGDIKHQSTLDINVLINDISKRTFDKNREKRGELYSNVIDVEAEIIKEDTTAENNLKGVKSE